MTDPEFHKQDTLPGLKKPPGTHLEAPPSLPKKIGTYPIEGLYREGGMCFLYLASRPETRDPVIIKVLKPHLRRNPEVIAKFVNEANILALADHPNIVQLYEYEETSSEHYIAMEFIQGQSLHSIIEHNPVSLRRAVEIILEIAYALCHLHTLGVIHRDLKPENILITDQHAVKLIDMGVAQMLSASHHKTPQPQLVGTPIYMSPEQHSNPEEVSYASDIYSLGIIAYELVLGKLSHGQIHLALMPKGLQKIIAKALQRRVEDRYQDVVDLITDLSAYLNSANLERERKGTDQLGDLSMHLQQAKMLMLPLALPQWPGLDVGVSIHRSIVLDTIYYDFITLSDERYAIAMVEPTNKGVEGIIEAAILKGLIAALSRLATTPSNLATFLNDVISSELPGRTFLFNYAMFIPSQHTVSVISCGPSHVWIGHPGQQDISNIPNSNPALGSSISSEHQEVSLPWRSGDSLYILSEALCTPSTNQMLQSLSDLPPQKLTDAIIRKATASDQGPLEQIPLCAISVMG